MADFTLSPGCDSQSGAATRHPALPTPTGIVVQQNSRLRGVFPFLLFQLPVVIGQDPVLLPSPLVPPDLRGCSEPSGVENNPAGHLLNSVMQLFQELNNWTLCSHWVGTGNLGSSLEDTFAS